MNESGLGREDRRALAFRVTVFVLVLFSLALLLVWSKVQTLLRPADTGSTETVVVEVRSGSTSADIAEDLARKGLIRSAAAFRMLARYRGLDGRLQAGEYRLSASMEPGEILEKMARGEVVTYTFTIPEGYTVEEIARKLAAEGFVDREEFLRVAREEGLRPEFVPKDVELKEPLEGYLFPETYQVTKGAGEKEIIRIMVERFQAIFKPEYGRRAQELGLTVHQVVTLASIIEEEAMVDEERPLISAVYHNRLRIGMKLDADPTLKYVLTDGPRPLTDADKGMDSPYNTYRFGGLPPGPISNPGEASIRAALYPAEVDYLYFVSKNDGTHQFSKTYREHLRNVARYR